MNPFGFLGKLNPLQWFGGYFERHPWQKRLLILAPFLLLLALLNPVIGAVDKLLSLLGRLLGPLLETGLGRAIVLVLLVLVAAVIVYAFAKERVLDVFRRHALSLHVRGCEALLTGDRDRAARDFRRVVRLGRWFDLARGPAAQYGSLAVDARLKLARIHLDDDDVRKARAELARVPQALLKKRLALSFAEINARVFVRHPDHLAESVLQVLASSHEAWPGHPGIAELYADKLIEQGRSERATEVLAETMRRASRANAPRVGKRLAELYLRLAEAALLDGRLKEAGKLLERSLRLDETEAAMLCKADVHLAKGELETALSVLRDVESPAAKERIAHLLRHDAQPLDPRKLLKHVPRRDALLALAELYIERGEVRRAERALEVCRRDGPPSARVFALLACVKLQREATGEAGETLRLALDSLGK